MILDRDGLVDRTGFDEVAGVGVDDVTLLRHDRVTRGQDHYIRADGHAVTDGHGRAVQNGAVGVDERMAAN